MDTLNNPHIILFDPYSQLTKSQMHDLVSCGISTVQIYMYWDEIESEAGIYSWDKYDRYVDDILNSGLNLLCRMPLGAPTWAPADWFFRSRYGTNADGDRNNRFFSLWNEDATQYTEAFIREACARYRPCNNITCCSGIGWCGETTFPVFMGEDYYNSVHANGGRGLWAFDNSAIANYRTHIHEKYKSISAYNAASECSCSDWGEVMPEDFGHSYHRLADTVEWYNQSACIYFKRILRTFAQNTSSKCQWVANVPRDGYLSSHIDAGMFRAEDLMENLRQYLAPQGMLLNQLWYSIFLTDPDTFGFHIWLLRHYPEWNVWIGAETASNIIASSKSARAAGCKGVIVGNPFYGSYATVDTATALSNIEQSALYWVENPPLTI